MKHWRLDTDNQTLVLASLDNRVPCLIYWGQKLPGDESLENLIEATKKDWGDNLLDKVPDLSILPEQSANFNGQLGCKIRDINGQILSPHFIFQSEVVNDNLLALTYIDKALGLTYIASITAYSSNDIFALSARIESDNPINMEWLSAPVIAASQSSNEMIDYGGQWGGEFRK
ncbi:alpha-galactosidase, partial [bacterium]|nr:alpha-galactosidase [bacterium]